MNVQVNFDKMGGGMTEVERVIAGVIGNTIYSFLMKEDAQPYEAEVYTSGLMADADYIDWGYSNGTWIAQAKVDGYFSFWNKGVYSAPQHYSAGDTLFVPSGWTLQEGRWDLYGVSISAWK